MKNLNFLIQLAHMQENAPKNNIEKGNKQSYEEILNEVEKIIDNPDEIKSFIDKRLKEIENKNDKGTISIMAKDFHQGFINSESPIRRSYLVEPFYMDDDSLYEDIFSVIKKFKESPGWKEKPLRAMMPYVVQQTIIDYFGNITSYSNTEEDNQSFYIDRDDTESSRISIKEFRGKKFAVCAEKSALAENITSFLGLESYLVLSDSCKIGNETGSLHAYNIWKTNNGYFIYDPSNPAFNLEKDTHKILNYAPAVYPISEDDFNKIKNGGTTEVKHTNKISDPKENTTEIETVERTYGGNKK